MSFGAWLLFVMETCLYRHARSCVREAHYKVVSETGCAVYKGKRTMARMTIHSVALCGHQGMAGLSIRYCITIRSCCTLRRVFLVYILVLRIMLLMEVLCSYYLNRNDSEAERDTRYRAASMP